jgi:hypothetical protein
MGGQQFFPTAAPTDRGAFYPLLSDINADAFPSARLQFPFH